MLGNATFLALCTSAVLALCAGCTPDSPTVAGPDGQLEHTGLAARDQLRSFGLTGGETGNFPYRGHFRS